MKTITHFILAIFTISANYAQVGINADNSAPHSSAQLDVKSTTKAFYPPRMTTAQKNAIASPQAGAVVFDNTLNQLSFYNGTAWVAAAGSVLTLPYNQSLNLATPNLSGIFTIGNYYTDSQANAIVGNTYSAAGNGVIGQNYAENGEFGAGVAGIHFGTGIGIIGNSILGIGVFGKGKINGVYGESETGSGVVGKALGTNPNNDSRRGVSGESSSTTDLGIGVYGSHAGTGKAIHGYTENGWGVYGLSTTSLGVYGSSNSGTGVLGQSNSGPGGFFSSSSGNALITNSGNVGIGVTNPSLNADERVDINGRLRIRSTTSTAGVWFNNTANNIASANGAFYGMKTDTETGIWINDAWRFWVNSVGNATLLGTLTQSSDLRLKKEFSLLNNSLSDIYKINGYHYYWKSSDRSQDLQTGLIAQEVQKIFPELVHTDDKGFLSVNYIGLIPHLLEAVKELKNENNLLKTENNSFKNNQTRLESRIDKMESLLNSLSKNTASN